MPGRPSKARRKVAGETKKFGMLPRTGLAIICSICYVEAITREGILKEKCTHTTPRVSVRAERPTGSRNKRGKSNRISSTAPTDLPASSCSSHNYHASSSVAGTTKKGRGRENTSPDKRPRVMRMGVFQAANNFKPDMPSNKIYSTGHAKVTRSADITSDIGYTPSTTSKLK
ncbi:hypothetical protein H5410_052275 [Solanum commersonii]|uniref:Uncharacterized protein n=1 Tax=Solanum commersonii TaxID=4109 RepID=A0A9J5X3K7_SOLCO|nr:hypothetical protein H5410_052275 [Solanum commersonii]